MAFSEKSVKRAVIVGSEGQDGRLLFSHLEEHDYGIVGIGREGVRLHSPELQSNSWGNRIDITKESEVVRLISEFQPDEVYYLAARHQSSEGALRESISEYKGAFQINVEGLMHFLEAVKNYSPKSKVFYASSSHVFGTPENPLQNERTPLRPESIYAITKVAGMNLCDLYRRVHGVFASVGILYNHESSLRRSDFVTKKIVQAAFRIKNGQQSELKLGDLSAEVDWGYAPDFVRAMKLILGLDHPDQFIIATGERHTVREFVEIVFSRLGLRWEQYIRQEERIITRAPVIRSGDHSKLRGATGWTPSLSFSQMVEKLVDDERNGEPC